MNKLAVAVKRGDEAELLCEMLAESDVREEDEDGCTVAATVQSFAAAWNNMVETKLTMNGELVSIIIMSVAVLAT